MEPAKNDATDKMERALKPFALPIGLASPMWLAFGAAASMTATVWWMKKWTEIGKAAPGLAPASAPVPIEPVAAAHAAPEPVAIAAPPVPEPVVQAEPAPTPAPEPDPTPDMAAPASAPSEAAPVETAPAFETIDQPDELTLLRGVGPRVADALVARGVSTFAQLAAWTETDMAAFDAELKLLGRSKRYDFLGQAKELAATA